ncbi:hypothetical protein HZU77_014775 [Neisseriaceae bacterium TC5R-5]|nr:hypothetical protein [Neisseriaceae bacterium TC5R-5]
MKPRKSFREAYAEPMAMTLPGAICDWNTYSGVLRIILLSILIGLIMGNFYAWTGLLHTLFGEPLTPDQLYSPAKMYRHEMTGILMSASGVLSGLLLLFNLPRVKRRRAKSDAEVAERLRERGLSAEPPPQTWQQRWPLLCDLIWGWPLWLALASYSVETRAYATLAILLAWPAYLGSYYFAKRPHPFWLSVLASILFGLLACAAWYGLRLLPVAKA